MYLLLKPLAGDAMQGGRLSGRRPCWRQPHQPALPKLRAGAGKGFGEAKYAGQVKQAEQTQLQATELLAKLLQASDARTVASQHVDSLNEQFFQIGSTFMQMAQKEGNTAVYEQVKAALTAAMEVKQSTLRPEIQLLNRLLAVEGAVAWKQILNTKQAGEQLTMNDGYFLQLLDRMAQDVARQPDNPQKAQLQQKLAGIRLEALARLPKQR